MEFICNICGEECDSTEDQRAAMERGDEDHEHAPTPGTPEYEQYMKDVKTYGSL